MAKSKYHVGLEIGTSVTRMVVAELKPDHSVKILGVGQSKTAGVRKGEIVDFNSVKTCIRTTLLEAEDLSDIDIRSVFLSISGGHIRGVNNTAQLTIPESHREVREEHVTEVEDLASDIAIPSDHAYIHSLVRNYRLDGQEHRSSPVGLIGKKLEADFHLVHGVKSRIENTIKAVREASLEVDDLVFAPIASAQIALNRERKEAGALVIDIGGGSTDYVLYVNGSIASSGSIPIGGDHVTNDIHLVTHIPLLKAEKLKIDEGDISGSPESREGFVRAEDEIGFIDQTIERKVLNGVITARFKELFKLLRERLPSGAFQHIGTGIFLTGGASQTKGLAELALQNFGIPVYKPEVKDLSGSNTYFKDPQLSTALGLIRYAQILEQEQEKTNPVQGILGKIFPFWK